MSPPIRTLSLLVALVLSLPLGHAAGAPSRPALLHAPPAGLASVEPPPLAWAHANPRDPHTYFDATMNLLKPVLPGMATSTSAAPNTEANRAAPWRYPFAAGDLRGTGGQDLLVFDVLLDENYTYPATRLEALSGATGATLWTLAMDPPSPAGAASIPDVDGDGGRDVILLTFSAHFARADGPRGGMVLPDLTVTLNPHVFSTIVTT